MSGNGLVMDSMRITVRDRCKEDMKVIADGKR